MNRVLGSLTIVVALLAITTHQGSGGDKKEIPLGELGEEYAAAYKKHDAKAVAGFYAPDADYVMATGEVAKGREQIEKAFAKDFTANPDLKSKVTVTSRRMVGTDLIIDDGTWELAGVAKGQPSKGRYTVIVQMREGKWQILCHRVMIPVTP